MGDAGSNSSRIRELKTKTKCRITLMRKELKRRLTSTIEGAKRRIAFIAKRVLLWTESPKDDLTGGLHSLAPDFIPSEHSEYIRRLQQAVFEDGCCNVALSGSYGSGKSSILARFEEEASWSGHKLAKVSLATISLDDEMENQAKDKLSATNENGAGSPRVVEQLEREILGQLLYQGDCSKAKESAFNRIHRQSFCQAIMKVVLITAGLLLLIGMSLFIADNSPIRFISG